jgi:DNA mismatch repair protein MSH2
MPDFSRLSKRLQRRMSSLEEVVRIYQAILKLPDLIEKLEQIDLSTADNEADARALLDQAFISGLREFDASLKPYLELVESTIDLASLDSHTYAIKPDFDDSLAEIKQGLEKARDGLDDEHQRAGRSLGLDTDKKLHLENHQVYGYCLRVTKAVRPARDAWCPESVYADAPAAARRHASPGGQTDRQQEGLHRA